DLAYVRHIHSSSSNASINGRQSQRRQKLKNQTLKNLSLPALIWMLQVLAGPQLLWAAAQEPNNIEQLIIYELNRARENPARFDREHNLSGILNAVPR